MARKLRVEIEGESKSGRKALDDVADEADKAAISTAALAKEFRDAAKEGGHLEGELKDVGGTTKEVQGSVSGLGRQTDKLAEEFRDAARAAAKLDGQLATTRVELARLNKEYEQGGDAAVLKQIEKQYSEYDRIAKLKSRMRKDEDDAAKRSEALAKAAAVAAERNAADAAKRSEALAKAAAVAAKRDAADAAKRDRADKDRAKVARVEAAKVFRQRSKLSNFLGIGESAGEGAFGALGSVGSSAAGSPWLLGAGAAIAAPAATFIGAAAGGALGFGAAGAGVGLGLAGAWMGDPVKYGAMWDTTINKLQRRWLDSSKQFSGPLEDSLKVVDRVIRDLPVERIADISKGFVGPLVEGAGGFVTNVADGFAELLASAQPIVDTVGPELANLGHDVGDAMRAIGLGSEGGALALGDLVNAMGYAIKATGVLIMGFENTYKAIRDFESANFDFIATVPVVGGVVQGLKDKLYGVASTTITAGKALHGVGDSADDAARGVAGLSFALDEYRSKALAMADANVAVAQGWLDLKKELKDGARSLDLTTQAGIDNQKAIIGQIGLLEQQRQQAIATGDGSAAATAKANAEYAASVEKIRAAAIAAGFNKEKVDALIASLGAVPPATGATVNVYGLGGAIEGTGALARLLKSIEGNYFANIKVTSTGPLSNLLGMSRHADGGTMSSSGPKLVGEEGPEIVWGSKGEYVSTAQQTRQLVSSMSGGSGAGGSTGGGRAMAVTVTFAGDTDQAFASSFQNLVRTGRIQIAANAA